MKKVITKIVITTKDVPEERLTEELLNTYKKNVYKLIRDETDESANIDVDVEIVDNDRP